MPIQRYQKMPPAETFDAAGIDVSASVSMWWGASLAENQVPNVSLPGAGLRVRRDVQKTGCDHAGRASGFQRNRCTENFRFLYTKTALRQKKFPSGHIQPTR